MNNSLQVLDHGSVTLRNIAGPTRRVGLLAGPSNDEGGIATPNVNQLIDVRAFDADDTDPANAARLSFEQLDSETITLKDGSKRPRTRDDDMKLNEYLLLNQHSSPLEMIQVWIEVRVPIFIDRQLVRHRTWKRSEASARYTVLPDKWYIPEIVGGKAPNKKQGQEDNLSAEDQAEFKLDLNNDCQTSYDKYAKWITRGVAPEHARMHLHLNHYVHWLGSVDLHNMFHFLRLRAHSHAQIEAQKYAHAIIELLRPHLPGLMGLFDKHVRKA